jgi:hypothetical protein
MDPDYLVRLVAERVGPVDLRAEAAALLARRGALPGASGAAGSAGDLGERAEEYSPSPRIRWWVFAAGCMGFALFVAGQIVASRPSTEVQGAAPSNGPVSGARQSTPGLESTAVRALGTGLQPDSDSPCGARLEGAVSAADAVNLVDTYQAVEFRVVRTHDTGRVTFLNSRDPYQGHFYVAVFPADYDRFPEPPAVHFDGRCIVVQGRIELYRGAPQIVLRSPDDVRIIPE